MTSYKTLLKQASEQLVEQRSRFIGYAKPVSTEQEATDFINQIRQRHYDARHNVYAYILKNGFAKYSDDGEPQSTAGLPILEVMKNEGLSDVCVVVTRYFGGILLGTGGLVRAYSASAKLALNAGGVVTMTPAYRCNLKCDYNMYAKINSFFQSQECEIAESIFEEDIFLIINILTEKFDGIQNKITELSAGKVELVKEGETFIKIKG